MFMKLLGVCCAIAATGTVLVYGFGLQVQRPIAPLAAKQEAPLTTPRAPAVAASAPVQAPAQASFPEILNSETPQPDVSNSNIPNLKAGDSKSQLLEVAAAKQQALEKAAVATKITVTAEPVVAEPVAAEELADQVFVFWQPFRSRGSAQGFAQGLSARAEVPISVISEETDSGRHYRVVLPYDSEAQRLERLAKLESATRLEMGE